MTTTYTMTANENYDAANAAIVDAGNFPTTTLTETFGLGSCFDATNRELVYSVIIDRAGTLGVIKNTEAVPIWDGAVYVAPGADIPATAGGTSQRSCWNYYIGRKNIDTGVVTFYNAFNAANKVPVGIGDGTHTSDGTWERYVSDTRDTGGNLPILTNPRNGDMFVHMESCQLYQFRRTDSYSQTISPLRPVGNVNNLVLPLTCDGAYVYVSEINFQAPAVANLYLVPATYTAAEITADVKLIYATFALGSYWYDTKGDGSDHLLQYTQCIDGSNNTWFFTNDLTGKGDFRLWKFTTPSAFVYPTPPIDGGIANVTPWTSTTGPNSPTTSADSTYSDTYGTGRTFIGFNAGRTQLQMLSGTNFSRLTGGVAGDSTIVHTWYDIAGGTFGSTTLFHGYLDANFQHVASAADASFCITGVFAPTNTYLDADNDYAAGNYLYRWFFVQVNDVDAGVLTGNIRWALVKLTWNASAAPTVVAVYPERATWDAAYPTYQTFIGSSGAIYESNWGFFATSGQDVYLFDPTTNTFWLSAKQSTASGNDDNFFQFDATFTGRALHNFSDPPIMKLAISSTAARASVWSRIGRPGL